MIKFKDHFDMISCWDEAGRSLCQDTLDDIEIVVSELKSLDMASGWLAFEGQCRICNYTESILCPTVNDIDNQECRNCGNMAMQERDVPEWEQE